jgi:hypothetical protein
VPTCPFSHKFLGRSFPAVVRECERLRGRVNNACGTKEFFLGSLCLLFAEIADHIFLFNKVLRRVVCRLSSAI